MCFALRDQKSYTHLRRTNHRTMCIVLNVWYQCAQPVWHWDHVRVQRCDILAPRCSFHVGVRSVSETEIDRAAAYAVSCDRNCSRFFAIVLVNSCRPFRDRYLFTVSTNGALVHVYTVMIAYLIYSLVATSDFGVILLHDLSESGTTVRHKDIGLRLRNQCLVRFGRGLASRDRSISASH